MATQVFGGAKLKNTSRAADEHFAYKLYEAVFISLLLGTFMSMLNVGTELELDIFVLIGSNVLLLFPPIMAVAIYHAVHINRFELDKNYQKWTYLAILSLVLIAISVFQEIIPIMRSLANGTLQDFVSLYLERAIVHPISVIVLTLCFLWMHKKISLTVLFPFVFFLLVFVIVEILYLGRQLIGVIGKLFGVIVGISLIIVASLCIRQLLKD